MFAMQTILSQTKTKTMSTRLNEIALDFKAETKQGTIILK
jgi:hypothetical protein